MGKFAQLVIGPAGSGKSTYCRTLFEHINNLNMNYKGVQKRQIHFVNLDPAIDDVLDLEVDGSEDLDTLQKKQEKSEKNNIYSISITELITLQDVMEEMGLGPNGALLYCMEFFISQLNDWLVDHLGDYDEDYLVFDCPGQIELYSHVPLMTQLTDELNRLGYRVATVYCLDSQFVQDAAKFMSGSLMALSAMTMFQDCPHFNILTKCDILKQQLKGMNIDREEDESLENEEYNRSATSIANDMQEEVSLEEHLEDYLVPETDTLLYKMKLENSSFATNERFICLHKAIAQVITEFSLVSYLPLDITDETSIDFVLNNIDSAIQYGEDLEVADPYEDDGDRDNVMSDDYDY
jgi:GTPase SAR1 family protein